MKSPHWQQIPDIATREAIRRIVEELSADTSSVSSTVSTLSAKVSSSSTSSSSTAPFSSTTYEDTPAATGLTTTVGSPTLASRVTLTSALARITTLITPHSGGGTVANTAGTGYLALPERAATQGTVRVLDKVTGQMIGECLGIDPDSHDDRAYLPDISPTSGAVIVIADYEVFQ